MIECSHAERIAAEALTDLHAVEWALDYKVKLLARCEAQGEHALAASLARDITDLRNERMIHTLAFRLAQGAAA
jgi:hypothetical protein